MLESLVCVSGVVLLCWSRWRVLAKLCYCAGVDGVC